MKLSEVDLATDLADTDALAGIQPDGAKWVARRFTLGDLADYFGGGGSVSVNWGDIGGVITDQADLQGTLSGKLTVADNAVVWGAGALRTIAPVLTVGDTASGKAAVTLSEGSTTALGYLEIDMPGFTGGIWVGSTNGTRAQLGAYGSITGYEFDLPPFVNNDEILTEATGQLKDATLTALSGRGIGAATATDILDRAAGDTRYRLAGGSIAAADVTGLGYFATGTDAANLTGTVAAARTPAFTGDVTKPAGSGVTTIANDAVTYAKMQNVSATSRILGRKTAGTGDPEECTLSEILDFIGSAAQGDILYRGASGWAKLAAGTSGQFLKTQGAGANPVWAAAGGGSDPWTYVKLTADGTGTAGSAESTGLTVAGASLAANTLYEFEIVGSVKGATSAFRVSLVWPSGVTGTATLRVAVGNNETLASGDQSATIGGANNINSSSFAPIQAKGHFYTGGSAPTGSLDLQYNNTSGSSVHTIMKGSFLRYRSIP
jgi:hypothetical protein